jgi:hypothetical protein
MLTTVHAFVLYGSIWVCSAAPHRFFYEKSRQIDAFVARFTEHVWLDVRMCRSLPTHPSCWRNIYKSGSFLTQTQGLTQTQFQRENWLTHIHPKASWTQYDLSGSSSRMMPTALCVCLSIRVCAFVHVHVYVYVCARVYEHLHMYVYVYVCVCMSMCMCMYMCMCMCVCVYVCVCMTCTCLYELVRMIIYMCIYTYVLLCVCTHLRHRTHTKIIHTSKHTYTSYIHLYRHTKHTYIRDTLCRRRFAVCLHMWIHAHGYELRTHYIHTWMHTRADIHRYIHSTYTHKTAQT